MSNKCCIEHCNEYVKRILVEFSGCTEEFKLDRAVFSTFNHLSVYFPDAYEHMLKVWGIKNENN